ncbi:MAG: sigma-70 family RNA polymerase sigma factor [Bacteroidota bacterium]
MLKSFRKRVQEQDDLSLVLKYQREGDMETLGHLYARYMELVYGVSLKIFKDKAKAEDAVMSIFEELVVKLKKHDVSNFKSWLHVLARNHCLMQIRKNGKLKVQSIDQRFVQIADSEHPLFEDEEIDSIEHLQPCLRQLKERQRQCVELFYFQKKSYKEIAAMTGEEVGRVRSYIQNGRRNLKICIEKKHGTSIRR